MKLQYLLFVILFSASIFTQAQKEAAIWYFGENAGLDFNNGAPVVITDGQLVTEEGCSTIADSDGNLLFYTDGSTVWNRNHVIMANGEDLKGDSSSTQSGIIIPSPDGSDIFYIFTAPFQGQDGLYYNILDMSLDGGLGQVISKNILLTSPATEKLTAVQHANGTDIWVISHDWGNDAFLAYLVTPAGVNTTPVVSNVGFNLNYLQNQRDSNKAIGYIKASPNGNKIAVCHRFVGAELLDFDTSTGMLSNPLRLFEGNGPYYGVEFSPSSEVLYISLVGEELYQFDLTSTDILASAQIISGSEEDVGGMQLGIDGKIYVTFYNSISVINNPDIVGLGSNFIFNAINFPSGRPQLGLPPFIQSFFLLTFTAENLCFGNQTKFTANVTEPILSVFWDFGDGYTSTLEEPEHLYDAPGIYTVSVTVTTPLETKTETKDIIIFPTPVAQTVADVTECTQQQMFTVDLSTYDSSVLGSQDVSLFNVDYFLSQENADANTSPLDTVHEFSLGTSSVFARVSSTNNMECYATTQFNITAYQAPVIDTVLDWTVCDDDTDGLYSFDLSLKADEIYNDQDKTKFEILYFGSQADADAGTNPLPESYVNTAVTEEIFFRFQNSTYPTCYRTGSFILEVIPGVVANQPSNLEVCDDNNDGQANFDLRLTEPEIIGTQNTASMVISYHGSQNDADTGTNALNANSYLSTAYQNTIYVRVENASDTSCYDTTSFDLIIYDTPVVPTVTDWQLCDDNNDGRYTFDLTEKTNEIQAGNNGITVSYYTSLPDAEVSQNTVVGTFENTLNPQPVYYRMENQNNAQCYAIGTFVLHVFDTPTANTASDIIVCDSNKTGTSNFDLSQKDGEVLNGQDAMVYEVSYFTTELEAMNNENPLSKTSYQNSNLNETLWARVQHNQLDFCYDVSSFNLIVNPLPQIDLEEQYVVCPDSPELVIDGGDFETWAWQDSNGTVISTQRNLQVLELGDYSLTVTQTTNGLACENTAVCNVVSSGAPETLVVDFNGFSDEIQVELLATGVGQFEYSIDGENYQSSNRFTVFPGSYTVYVRDLYDCRTITDDITVIGYQRFFTPNGDGVNEHWNIIGRELYPNSQLYIFNRYGKLVGQFGDDSLGWDGRYNGQELSPTDYWFRFAYGEGEVFSGHFTLKR